MEKRKYNSPDFELIQYCIGDILLMSPMNPHDPQNPTSGGDEGFDGDL